MAVIRKKCSLKCRAIAVDEDFIFHGQKSEQFLKMKMHPMTMQSMPLLEYEAFQNKRSQMLSIHAAISNLPLFPYFTCMSDLRLK
jgi:hypothetical protein